MGALIAAYPAAMATLSGTLSIHVSWVEGILFPIYFVLGYLLYASLFAGLAAIVRDRAGTADVHAAGRPAHLAQLLADLAGDQRSQLGVVGGRLALSRQPRPSS